jgi:hypothetical protein
LLDANSFKITLENACFLLFEIFEGTIIIIIILKKNESKQTKDIQQQKGGEGKREINSFCFIERYI